MNCYITPILVVAIIILLFCFAVYWEIWTYGVISSITPVNQLPKYEKKTQLQSIACFNFNSGVEWRSSLIVAVIGMVILALITDISFWLIIFIGIMYFILVYAAASINNFHVQRELCIKADPYTLITHSVNPDF